MKLRILILFIASIALQKIAVAAPPPTWSVNPPSFQYSMTVTVVAEINCTELANPSNRIGAFVGSVCRGTALTSNVINGRYIATMTVYSDSVSNEKITLRVYNSSNDIIYDGIDTIAFQENATYGVSSSPFVLRNNNAPSAISLSNNTLNEGLPIATPIGNLSSTDLNAGQTHTYNLVSGTGSTNNNLFSISGNQLQTATVFNFGAQNSYSVRIRSTDNLNCSFEQVFTININDVNTTPTNIFISDSTVSENSSSLTVVGTLSALDNDLNETFSYALVSGVGSTDNASFNISGNALRTSLPFNFEVKSVYNIRIRVTDAANNTFEKPLTILIDDANDAPTNILLNGNPSGVSFAENRTLGALIATLSSVDEDINNSYIYSFVNTSGNNNSDFAIVGNQLRTNNLFDYETRQNYVVFIQTNDGNGGLFTKQFLINVTDSNDAPTGLSISNTTITENLVANTFIGKFSNTDPDGSGTYTYSLVSGAGSGGNSNFTVSNDSLYSTTAFDFETTPSYNIRANVNDGSGGNFQQQLTINVLNGNDAPTDINITSNQIAENLAPNASVGQFSTNDQDVTNTFVYTLVTGAGSTDNNSFNISGNTLRASASFDFETKNTYSIRVRTTDNIGASVEKVFTISITDVVDAPTNILLSNDSISENLASNTLVGTLSSVNQNSGLTFTYSFDNNISGNDNSSFIISGNELRSNASFDFETKNVYTLYITTTAGSTSFTKLMQVFVRNANDAPNNIILSNNAISENNAVRAFVGKLTTADPDNNPTYTYSLVSGVGATNNASFSVSNDSLFTNAVFDFETQVLYSIRLQTDDNLGGTFQKIVTVNITNVNDTPTNITLSENSINENLPANTNIGAFTSTDQDTNNTYFYTLVSGAGSTDNGNFTIVGNTLRSTNSFNFETKNSYAIRVRTSDNLGLWFEKQFTIVVNNLNDIPTNISLSNDTITENRLTNTLIGTLATTDEDVSNTYTYSFANIAGNSNNLFTLTSNQLRSNTTFNFEQQNVYFIYVQTNDGNGGTFVKQFQIHVKDSNDAPTDILLSQQNIAENSGTGSFIAKLSGSDADPSSTFTYSLVSGSGDANNSSFIIRDDSLFSNGIFDFEAKSTYNIRIRVTDNLSASFSKSFVINVTNGNDNPTNIQLSTTSVPENTTANTIVGSISTTDQDTANTFTYTLVSGTGSTDNGSFNINGNTLRTSSSFDFETKNTYDIRIRTTDNEGLWFEKQFTIQITNTNDVPTNITISNDTVSENRPLNTVIGLLSTTDQDANNFTYSFNNIPGNDNNLFVINGNLLRTNNVFNFEQQNAYYVYIQSNDGNGGLFTKQFQITIRDSNDAPTDIALSSPSIVENRPIGSFIGKFSSTDPDQVSNTFTYNLVSGTGSSNNSNFYISNDSLFNAVALNFEVQNTFSIRVRSTDNGALSFEKAMTITVNDSNDLPTDITLTTSSINENMSIGSSIGTLNTVDADAGQSFTYALVSGPGSTDNNQFSIQAGVLKTNAVFNFEVKNTYTIRIQTNDGNGGTFTDTFNISILNTNDAPTNIALSNATISENRSIGTSIGLLSTTDEDANSFTYSLANIGNNDNSNFIISNNELQSNVSFNFEAKKLYIIHIQTNDGNGGTFTKQFIININDSNDAPTDITLSKTSVNELMPSGTFIGVLTSTDIDTGNTTFNYALTPGTGATNNSLFQIRNDSLFTNAVFNFETANNYSIRISSTDNGGLAVQKAYTINVLNSNDAPTDLTLSNALFNENVSLGTTIGTFSTIDEDAGQTYSYTLVTGPGSTNNNLFSIQGNMLRTNAQFNFEQQHKYTIRVQTNDGNGGTFIDTFNLELINTNDAPTNIVLSNNVIKENRPNGSFIGTFTTVDEDTANTFSYTFTNIGTNDNASFIINGNQLTSNTVLNYENKQLYVVQIQTNDGNGGIFGKQFLINVSDSNDAPTDIALDNNTVSENLAIGTFVGKLSISDIDAGTSSFNYTLVNGAGSTHNNNFTVRNDSIFTNALFNFEQQSVFAIRIRSTDNGLLFTEKAFTINISDANDTPTTIVLNNNTIRENVILRSRIGEFITTDADQNNTFNYTLVSGVGSTDNAAFIISGNQLQTNTAINYENKQLYQIRVRSADNNGLFVESTFTITVVDSNDAPTQINISTNNLVENRPFASLVATFTTTDQDTGNSFVYNFVNIPGNDNGSFFITNNELRSGASFDFESKRVYNIYVQSSDGFASVSRQFVINITDSNDAPTNTLLTTNTVEENLPIRTFIGVFYTFDADASGTHNYTLVNGNGSINNGQFSISNDSLYTNVIFNAEAKNQYSIRVRTADQGGLWVEKQLDVFVSNNNDAPTDIQLSSNEITENRPNRSFVAALSSTDEDINTFTYTLVAGPGSTDNNAFVIQGGQLRSNAIFNYEHQNQYNIRLQTNDGNGGTFEKAFVINILESNDIPTNISLLKTTIRENAPIGSKVTDILTSDQDMGDFFSYNFVNISGNDNNQFFLTGNELRTSTIFDFESKNYYLIYLQSTDSRGTSITRQFIINVTDSNDKPTAIQLSNNSIAENLPSGTFIGLLTSTDPDQSSNFNYQLAGGPGANDNSSFRIANDSLLSNVVFNFESKKTFSIRLRTVDNTNEFFDQQFTLEVSDANDAPNSIGISSTSLAENSAVNTMVGILNTVDIDADDTHTYQLVSGTGSTDNALFNIENDKITSNFVADFELKSSYSIRVQSKDKSGDSIERSITINIADKSEKPSILNQSFNISENSLINDVVGTISASSPDAGANLIFTWAANTTSTFSLNETTGQITVANNLDYEKRRLYVLTIVVKDDQTVPQYDTATITINVIDEIESKQTLPANNYMSPNGDGLNDLFVIENVQLYADYSLTIYNEANIEVFKVLSNYNNDWDGTFNNKQLPTGVYFYVFRNPKNGAEFKGSLNILKQ